MLLTLTAGPGGDHTLMEGPRRVVPVGSADAELRLTDVLITISQLKKKRPILFCTRVWGQIQVSQEETPLAHNGGLVQLSCSDKGLNTACSGTGGSLQLHVKMTHSSYEYHTSFDVLPDTRSSQSREEVDPGGWLCGVVRRGPGHVWQHPEAPGEIQPGNYPRTSWDNRAPFHPSLSLSLPLFLFLSPATEELDPPRITTCLYTFTVPGGITVHFPELNWFY